MRKIFVALVVSLIFSSAFAFSDVEEDYSSKSAIDYLAQHAVVAGFPDGEFKADQNITRAELAKIVVKIRGENPDSQEFSNCFPEVNTEWYARFVCFAKQKDWFVGYPDGSFQPANFVNRAEAAKIILSALGVAFDDSQKFSDIATEDWFAIFANTIRSKDLLDFTSFTADKEITRGEVAELVFRILVLKDSGEDFFDPQLAIEFDIQKIPAEVLANSMDFPATTFTNLQITKWQISGGLWLQKPILEFNGKSFEFSTPQDYITTLQKIQKHFEILGDSDFTELIISYISEFQTVLSDFSQDSVDVPLSENSQNSTIASVAVSYSADFTNVDFFDEAAVKSHGGVFVQQNNTTIYSGFENTPPLNRNPVLVSFTDGKQDWVRRDYETSADESVGYGLLWGGEDLFAVFTSQGVEENSDNDFRRFAEDGWLSEYGEGEGNQIAVIAKINPANGDVFSATFLSAKLDSGETNSLTVKDLQFDEENLVVFAECWHAPRKTSGQPMDQKFSVVSLPFDYVIELTPDLRSAVRAEAPSFGE